MIENNNLTNLLDQQPLLTQWVQRQRKPSQRGLNSPRLITRKKETRQMPISPFARRKSKRQDNSILRYLSPKIVLNESRLTILSDDDSVNFSQFQDQPSMFNLQLSRLKSASKLEDPQLDNSKQLYDDISNSQEFLIELKSTNSKNQKKSQQYPKFETERLFSQKHIKSEVSLETIMPQSSNLEQGQQLTRQNRKLIIQNLVLERQNKKLVELNKMLKMKDEQTRTELQGKCDEISNLSRQIEKKEKMLGQRVTELQVLLQKSLENEKQSQTTISNHLSSMSHLQEINITLQSQSSQKERNLISLTRQRDCLKNQLQQNHQLRKCLEDSILELNGKIDSLKKENKEMTHKIEETNQKYRQIQTERELLLSKIHHYQQEISRLKTYVNNQLTQISSGTSFPHVINLSADQDIIQHLQKQLTSLNLIINIEKQENEKLKKLINYKLIEIDFLKKNQYQKNSPQIISLKQRNKRLIKKLNRILEDFENFKEKTSNLQKKPYKNNQLKKTQSTPDTDVESSTIFSKNVFETQNEHKASNRVNNHQAQLKGCHKNQSNLHKNTNLIYDSDDELSFKLSPEKC